MTETVSFINHSLEQFYPPEEIRSFTRLIIEHITGLKTHQFILHKDKKLSIKEKQEITQIITRLQQYEPIQYILGKTWFYELEIITKPGVLIPRPETEELVDLIIKSIPKPDVSILDIGTGSGCIAIALAKNLSQSKVYALDISEKALSIAFENAQLNNVSVNFIQDDILNNSIFETKNENSFDILVSNPPYVLEMEKAQMKKNVLDFEPKLALFVPDNDPLIFYRSIAHFGKQHLKEGGMLYFEINAMYGKETVEMLKKENYKNVCLINDLSGKERFIKVQK